MSRWCIHLKDLSVIKELKKIGFVYDIWIQNPSSLLKQLTPYKMILFFPQDEWIWSEGMPS